MTENNTKYNPETGRRILQVKSHSDLRPTVSTNSPSAHVGSESKNNDA